MFTVTAEFDSETPVVFASFLAAARAARKLYGRVSFAHSPRNGVWYVREPYYSWTVAYIRKVAA